MIQIISGEKGKGKTKILLDKVNANVKECKGTLVYLDKNTKHMYELNNRVRLINVTSYFIQNADEFVGFISGIASQDSDLEKIYLDSFLNIACLEEKDIEPILKKLDLISAKFGFDLIISISVPKDRLPEFAREKVIVAL